MKLASYTGTRAGWRGAGNVITRWRVKDRISHNEIVFEPTDPVGMFMPDKTAELLDGAYWCGSSTATDIMPPWSQRRAGHIGGVRFKRIELDPNKWILRDLNRCDAVLAAETFKRYEGDPYDWENIASYINFLLAWQNDDRKTCNEICGMAIGLRDPWRFSPPALDCVASLLK